jgi:hypothetical protein
MFSIPQIPYWKTRIAGNRFRQSASMTELRIGLHANKHACLFRHQPPDALDLCNVPVADERIFPKKVIQ